jgi:hypothetical protein
MTYRDDYTFNRSWDKANRQEQTRLTVATIMSNSGVEKQTAIDALHYCRNHPEMSVVEYIAGLSNPLFMTRLKLAERVKHK